MFIDQFAHVAVELRNPVLKRLLDQRKSVSYIKLYGVFTPTLGIPTMPPSRALSE